MQKLINWEVAVKGNSAVFRSPDLSEGQLFQIYIFTPNRQRYLWNIIGNGNITEQSIVLDSGNGQYIFVPAPDNCQFLPFYQTLNNCVCEGEVVNRCDIAISGPSSVSLGSNHSLAISGALPSTLISIKVTSAQGEAVHYSLLSDTNGNARFNFTRSISGLFSVTVSDGVCISAPFQIEVLAQVNNPTVIDTAIASCEGAIVVTTRFSASQYQQTAEGTLKVSFTNSGLESRWLSAYTTANFVLSSGTIPSQIYLNAGETREFIFTFTAPASESTLEFSVIGTYECNGKTYNSVGGAGSALVGSGSNSSSCLATISNFQITTEDSSPTSASLFNLEFTVLNVGVTAINATQISLTVLPEGVSIDSSYTPSSQSIPIGSSVTLSVPIRFDSAGSYSFQLPEGTVQYGCNGTPSQVIPQALFANYNVS